MMNKITNSELCVANACYRTHTLINALPPVESLAA